MAGPMTAGAPPPGPQGPLAGAAPGMPPEGATPPLEAPLPSPQKPHGDEALADVNVKMALDVLTNVLPIYGATSEKGKALMDVLKKLSMNFGVETSKHAEAVPAEIAALVGAMPPGQGGPPQSPVTGGPPLPPQPAPPGA